MFSGLALGLDKGYISDLFYIQLGLLDSFPLEDLFSRTDYSCEGLILGSLYGTNTAANQLWPESEQ